MMLSVVDAASVMYWNMCHFFVVFFSKGPQVKVNKSRVDVTALPISLLHKLPQMVPDSLHTPDGATPDLHLSPLTRAQQFTCERTNNHYNNTAKSICLFIRISHKTCQEMSTLKFTHNQIHVAVFQIEQGF